MNNTPLSEDECTRVKEACRAAKEQYTIRSNTIPLLEYFKKKDVYDHNIDEVLENGQLLYNSFTEAESHYRIFIQRMNDITGICSKSHNASISKPCIDLREWTAKVRKVEEQSDRYVIYHPLLIPNQSFYGPFLYHVYSIFSKITNNITK